MTAESRKILPYEARAALAHLWKAFACAQDLRIDPWEFSLRLTHLLDLGVDENDLRWLVLNGYADYADEMTTFRDPARRFQCRENVAFSGETCFVITEAGALIAACRREGADSPPGGSANSAEIASFCSAVPQWDRKLRELSFDGRVVKQFRLPAKNQELLLSAFEEEGWPRSIDDPLPYVAGRSPKARLHVTIRSLNANQANRLLHFRGNGTGEAVLWEPIVESAVDRPAIIRLHRAA